MKKTYLNNNIEPTRIYRLVSLWEEVADLIDHRCWSQSDFANIIGLSDSAISSLLRGRYNLTADLARKLEAIFDKSANYWLDRDTEFMQLYQDEKVSELRKMSTLAQVHTVFPISILYTWGLVDAMDDPEPIMLNLLELLGEADFNEACVEYVDFAPDQNRSATFRDILSFYIRLRVLKERIISKGVLLADLNIQKVRVLQRRLMRLAEMPDIEAIVNELKETGVGYFLDIKGRRSYTGGLFELGGHPIIITSLGYQDSILQHVIQALSLIMQIYDSHPTKASAVLTSDLVMPARTLPISQSQLTVIPGSSFNYDKDYQIDNRMGTVKSPLDWSVDYVWESSPRFAITNDRTRREYFFRLKNVDLSSVMPRSGIMIV